MEKIIFDSAIKFMRFGMYFIGGARTGFSTAIDGGIEGGILEV